MNEENETQFHKSIFDLIDEYKSDPITEYKKIDDFIRNTYCADYVTIYETLKRWYPLCEKLFATYPTFEKCLDVFTESIQENKYNIFSYLSDNSKKDVLDDFLNYCEVLSHIVVVHFGLQIMGESNNNRQSQCIAHSFKGLLSVVETSLKSMGFKLEILDEDSLKTRAIKINPQAEFVAAHSPQNIRETIICYLAARDGDITAKENELHRLIDLLEPTFKKCRESPISDIKDIKEYTQLLRHPEVKKNETGYKWFYDDKNKEKYLDDLFSMCVFVEEYQLVKENLKEFKERKTSEMEAENKNKESSSSKSETVN